MAEQLREKWTSLSGKLKLGGAEVSKKVTTSMSTVSDKMKELAVISTVSDKMKELAGMSSVGEKMKELFRVSTATDKLVEELTSEDILLSGHQGPDWPRIMALCDAVNQKDISTQEIVKSLRKRLMFRNQGNSSNAHASIDTIARTQLLTLILIEALVKNCENVFVEISNQHVLDEMVKIVDDPTTAIITRDKTLKLIESWGEMASQLRNLPMFEETYKSLKSRGVKFPLRDPESLAPIFTPPRSTQTASRHLSLSEGEILLGTYEGLGMSQVDEILQTARNSIELLSTVLTSSPKEEAQDELMTTLADQCRQSHAAVQRIAEQVANDEALLFEILNINDELQKVISKYEEVHCAHPIQTMSESQPAVSPTVEENQSSANPEGAATVVPDNVS